jgi:hypothetical protein
MEGNEEDACLWILNSCTVKTPSGRVSLIVSHILEDSLHNLIKDAKTKSKFVVVAGCVPRGQRSDKRFEGLSVIGVWPGKMNLTSSRCIKSIGLPKLSRKL